MKKIVILLIVGILVLSGLGAVAIPKDNKLEITDSISFSEPTIQDMGEYVTVNLEDTDICLMEPGKPMLPKYVTVFDLPFGATNIKVECTSLDVREQPVLKEILPAPEPVPLMYADDIVVETVKDDVYSSHNLYPDSWFSYRVGCGLNSGNEHVTHVSIQIFPVRYSPLDGMIYYIDGVDISVTYDETSEFTFDDKYDMVIIAPRRFSLLLHRLVDHKNNHGVSTILKTVESIYDEYPGVDKPEQIKYFIKDAIENWNINYVLLFGGLKHYIDNDDRDNMNEGSTDWHVPVRYTNFFIGETHVDPGYISDLYYADIYKEGGEFEDWDSNDDGVFAAWGRPGVEDDILDLYPDVCIGRLACRNIFEVLIMVNKIINYERTPCDQSWFNKIVCVAGDRWPEYNIYEGEWLCDRLSSYMPLFDSVKVYASNRDTGLGLTPTPENITRTISDGCGFLLFEGSGNSAAWSVFWPDSYEWTPAFMVYHFPMLLNGRKLPVCVVGGCHNSMFNVSLYKTGGPDNASYWTYGLPIPECWSWWMTRKIGGGSIATIGPTGIGHTLYQLYPLISSDLAYTDYIDMLFFKAYDDGRHVLGEAWSTAVDEYLSTSDNISMLDTKTVQSWVLLGDPSLMIGGYAEQSKFLLDTKYFIFNKKN